MLYTYSSTTHNLLPQLLNILLRLSVQAQQLIIHFFKRTTMPLPKDRHINMLIHNFHAIVPLRNLLICNLFDLVNIRILWCIFLVRGYFAQQLESFVLRELHVFNIDRTVGGLGWVLKDACNGLSNCGEGSSAKGEVSVAYDARLLALPCDDKANLEAPVEEYAIVYLFGQY